MKRFKVLLIGLGLLGGFVGQFALGATYDIDKDYEVILEKMKDRLRAEHPGLELPGDDDLYIAFVESLVQNYPKEANAGDNLTEHQVSQIISKANFLNLIAPKSPVMLPHSGKDPFAGLESEPEEDDAEFLANIEKQSAEYIEALKSDNVSLIESLILDRYRSYEELLSLDLANKKSDLQQYLDSVRLLKEKKAEKSGKSKHESCPASKDSDNLVKIEQFLIKNFRNTDGNLISYADLLTRDFDRKKGMYNSNCGLYY